MEYQPHEKGELWDLRIIFGYNHKLQYYHINAAAEATWAVSRGSGYKIVNWSSLHFDVAQQIHSNQPIELQKSLR